MIVVDSVHSDEGSLVKGQAGVDHVSYFVKIPDQEKGRLNPKLKHVLLF